MVAFDLEWLLFSFPVHSQACTPRHEASEGKQGLAVEQFEHSTPTHESQVETEETKHFPCIGQKLLKNLPVEKKVGLRFHFKNVPISSWCKKHMQPHLNPIRILFTRYQVHAAFITKYTVHIKKKVLLLTSTIKSYCCSTTPKNRFEPSSSDDADNAVIKALVL